MGKKYKTEKWRFIKPVSKKIQSLYQYNIISSLIVKFISFLRKHYDVQNGLKKDKFIPYPGNLNEFEINLSYINDNPRCSLFCS